MARRMGRSGQDVIGFTRIFVLFCTLVLVPALFLSGFGVIAILNERQAERQRRADAVLDVLEAAQRTFAELLEATDRAARKAAEAPDMGAALDAAAAAGHAIGPWALFTPDGVLVE